MICISCKLYRVVYFEYKNFDITSVSRASLGNYASNRMEAASNYTQITNLNRLSNVHRSYLDTRVVRLLLLYFPTTLY